MWSKQKIKKHVSNFVQSGEISDNSKRIKRLSPGSRKVIIKAIRGKHQKKQMKIKLFNVQSWEKKYIYLNLNRTTRPNYKDGSKEMFRMVNGLCHYCGHDSYSGKLYLQDWDNYVVADMKCDKCHKFQPYDYVIYPGTGKKDRGKEYAERKKKPNMKGKFAPKSDVKKKTNIKRNTK